MPGEVTTSPIEGNCPWASRNANGSFNWRLKRPIGSNLIQQVSMWLSEEYWRCSTAISAIQLQFTQFFLQSQPRNQNQTDPTFATWNCSFVREGSTDFGACKIGSAKRIQDMSISQLLLQYLFGWRIRMDFFICLPTLGRLCHLIGCCGSQEYFSNFVGWTKLAALQEHRSRRCYVKWWKCSLGFHQPASHMNTKVIPQLRSSGGPRVDDAYMMPFYSEL